MQLRIAALVCVLALMMALCDPTCGTPLTRVRRQQGWSWGGGDEFNRPTRPTAAPWLPTATTPAAPSQDPNDPNTTTTTASPAYTRCMATCQTTKQYNPVCGSNRVTYENASLLKCARNCGVAVDVLFNGTCSPVTR